MKRFYFRALFTIVSLFCMSLVSCQVEEDKSDLSLEEAQFLIGNIWNASKVEGYYDDDLLDVNIKFLENNTFEMSFANSEVAEDFYDQGVLTGFCGVIDDVLIFTDGYLVTMMYSITKMTEDSFRLELANNFTVDPVHFDISGDYSRVFVDDAE